jgi:hypothetical protein
MPVYDSSDFSSVDTEAQESALSEFVSWGGDRALLEAALQQTAATALRLRREQEAVQEHFAATTLVNNLRETLDHIRVAKTALQKVPLSVPDQVLAEESKVEAALQQAELWFSSTDPKALAERRRSAADNLPKRVHRQIGPLRLRTVRLVGLSPDSGHVLATPEIRDHLRQSCQNGILPEIVGIDWRTIDDAVRAIRRAFIPEVIRSVFDVVCRVRTAIHARELRRFVEKYRCRPDGDEIARLNLSVAKTLNELTCRVVRAFYPTWAAHLEPRHIRMTLENARKRSV